MRFHSWLRDFSGHFRTNTLIGQVCLISVFMLAGLRANAQVTLRLMLDADGVTYKVYMHSAVNYTGRAALISTAQVTLTVPHGLGNERFEITDLVSPIPTMHWRQIDRVNSPPENPDRDYLFFSFINNTTPTVLFDIVAGQDILIFQFKRKGDCTGFVQLLNNGTDEFRTPNSKGINVGNSVSILGALGNAYKGNLDEPPIVKIITSADTVCGNQSIELQADLSEAIPKAIYQYQWFVNDQPISLQTTTPTFTYFVPNRPKSDQVQIRIKVTKVGATACESQLMTATKLVFVKAVPKAQLTYVGETCTPLPITLSALSVPNASYQWMVGGQPLTMGYGQEFTVTESGYYSVQLTVDGCSDFSDTVHLINVNKAERTSVKIGEIPPLVAGQSIILNPQVTNATSFIWSPGDQLSSATVRNPVITPKETTSYTLTAQSEQGCIASDTVTIKLIPALFIPTAFSPNNDGVNDTWVIQNIAHHQPCRLRIYNRWGGTLYEQSVFDTPWDPQHSGLTVESGLYYYVIHTPYVSYSGSIMVVR